MSNALLHTLKGQVIRPLPVWFMRQAGRHLPEYLHIRSKTRNFMDICFLPQKAAEITLQPVQRYDVDAAILFSDILVIPQALGQNVQFEKGKGPLLQPVTVHNIASLDTDQVNDQLTPIYETVVISRSRLASDKDLIGFCGGMWTVATYMIEGSGSSDKEKARRFAYEEEDSLLHLLDILVEASAQYLIGQVHAGADVLKIFESWTQGLTPEQFKKFVILPTAKLINQIRDAGINVPIIGFAKGAGEKIIDYVHETKVDALALDSQTSVSWARQVLGKDFPLQGNLDILALRTGGKALGECMEKLLSQISGPHVFNVGHGLTPDVKIENVQNVIDHIRSGKAHYG